MRAPRPGARQRRLGQNFVSDPNLLDLIVREAEVGEGDVVLEVGGGGGALSERLAAAAGHLHLVELDERLAPELEDLGSRANVTLHLGDAMRLDLGALEPGPGKLVANLPYAIATPLLLRTIEELPELDSWLVMVQREIADRLRAASGSRTYGAPSALVQLACEVELVRAVGREVFTPRPRVDSALIRLGRRGPGPAPAVREVIRGAFAHRRKTLAASLELSGLASREDARSALEELGRPPDARAEQLAPEELARLAEALR